MPKNPMQRKAQNSFLLGMLITLLITGAIIAILIVQLINTREEMSELIGQKVEICALNTNVTSGQIITDDMVSVLEVDSTTIPNNAFGSEVSNISYYKLTDPAGNALRMNENGDYYVEYYNENTEQTEERIIIQSGDNYYYQDNNERVEITTSPIIAKVDMDANTILTPSLVQRQIDANNDDVRKVEYNMIQLATQIESGSYIDVRLRLPDGQDLIVVSHEQIEIPIVNGIESLNSMWFNLDETQILTLSCAIVESYKIPGSLLYVTEYVEPGLQDAATVTYLPSDEIINLIYRDPNCVEEAKQAIFQRNNNDDIKEAVRNPVNNALNQNAEDALDNVIDNVEEELQKTQEERQTYLESLGGTY